MWKGENSGATRFQQSAVPCCSVFCFFLVSPEAAGLERGFCFFFLFEGLAARRLRGMTVQQGEGKRPAGRLTVP
jgi:hypothetical protein